MQILVLNPETPIAERLEEKEVDSSKEGYLQEIVQGPLEFFEFTMEGNHYDAILHEEGKLNNLPPNIALFNKGKIFDFMVGHVVIAKADDEGRTIGLTDEDIEIIKRYFSSQPIVGVSSGHELFSYIYS